VLQQEFHRHDRALGRQTVGDEVSPEAPFAHDIPLAASAPQEPRAASAKFVRIALLRAGIGSSTGNEVSEPIKLLGCQFGTDCRFKPFCGADQYPIPISLIARASCPLSAASLRFSLTFSDAILISARFVIVSPPRRDCHDNRRTTEGKQHQQHFSNTFNSLCYNLHRFGYWRLSVAAPSLFGLSFSASAALSKPFVATLGIKRRLR
jgi:hypothetical protein